MQLELTAPPPSPPLSHESINALKCNLVLVQARVDVYHLSGLYSLGLTKYQVIIKVSDVMYFHVVESELIWSIKRLTKK